MIAAVAVCPHPPLLFRELTGQQDVAAELRAECGSAISVAIAADPDLMVVVGGDDETRTCDAELPARAHGYGVSSGSAAEALPLSLGVARRLLDEAGWQGAVEMHTIAWDASAAEVEALADRLTGRRERIALLALGEGSARRGDRAPGYLDDRAFAFDESTVHALSEGDVEALMKMDATLAEELMVSCRAALAVMATAVHDEATTPRCDVLYQDDPWGVAYFVASWELR